MVKRKDAQSKAKEAAEAARPYVQRLAEDEDLRANLRDAYDAARGAYDRAIGSKGPAKAVLEDRKLQKELRSAADSLRAASEALREPEKRSRRGGGFGRLLLVAFVAAVLAVVISEDLRRALLDRLFGAEEEFEYSSTTAPAAPTAETTG
jgi:ferric-dicitrate binding protein FerR (iron transport regulator)